MAASPQGCCSGQAGCVHAPACQGMCCRNWDEACLLHLIREVKEDEGQEHLYWSHHHWRPGLALTDADSNITLEHPMWLLHPDAGG